MERGETRDEKTIAVIGTPAVAVALGSVSLLASLDRGISHLPSPC
jgi:hypothetical protein